ncbi:MAG: hypothetical protein ACP5NF_05905 [Thermoanaerobaculum sp.]
MGRFSGGCGRQPFDTGGSAWMPLFLTAKIGAEASALTEGVKVHKRHGLAARAAPGGALRAGREPDRS